MNTHNQYDFISDDINIDYMKNRLFATFSSFEEIDNLIKEFDQITIKIEHDDKYEEGDFDQISKVLRISKNKPDLRKNIKVRSINPKDNAFRCDRCLLPLNDSWIWFQYKRNPGQQLCLICGTGVLDK